MTRSYEPIFVVLSVIVAMLASFAALDLAGQKPLSPDQLARKVRSVLDRVSP
jgi:NO-binding membrane sensor protein with MHYT domain